MNAVPLTLVTVISALVASSALAQSAAAPKPAKAAAVEKEMPADEVQKELDLIPMFEPWPAEQFYVRYDTLRAASKLAVSK